MQAAPFLGIDFNGILFNLIPFLLLIIYEFKPERDFNE